MNRPRKEKNREEKSTIIIVCLDLFHLCRIGKKRKEMATVSTTTSKTSSMTSSSTSENDDVKASLSKQQQQQKEQQQYYEGIVYCLLSVILLISPFLQMQHIVLTLLPPLLILCICHWVAVRIYLRR